MGATYRALCEHGYAELTMRDIAEESDRSKAALHYHYDDKEGLLVAFLDHIYASFVERVGEHAPPAVVDEALSTGVGAAPTPADSGPVHGDDPEPGPEQEPQPVPVTDPEPAPVEDPDARLRAFVDAVLHPPHSGDTREFRTALLEIKSQVPYVDAFRERIERFDGFVADTVRTLVEEGQEAGTYRESVDPDDVAQFVLVVLDGAGARHVIADAPVDCAIASFEDYLDAHLLVEGHGDGTSDHTTTHADEEPATEGASR